MTIYLYKKTHNKTGLKYLGKTTEDNPHKYTGSGTIWLKHIKEHGRDIQTEILKECTSNEELSYWGRYYSNLWNVVDSEEWANKIPETGGGEGLSSEKAVDMNIKKVKAGTHPFLKKPDGTSVSSDRVLSGTHNFLGGNIQREMNRRTLENGTHPSQKQWGCEHCGRTGKGAGNYTKHHGPACKNLRPAQYE